MDMFRDKNILETKLSDQPRYDPYYSKLLSKYISLSFNSLDSAISEANTLLVHLFNGGLRVSEELGLPGESKKSIGFPLRPWLQHPWGRALQGG